MPTPSWGIGFVAPHEAPHEPEPTDETELLGAATLAHFIIAVSASPDGAETSEAFEEGLDLVHTTHQALHATEGLSLVLPTAESTRMGIAVALEIVTPEGTQPEWPIGAYMLSEQLTEAPRELSTDALEALAAAELEVAIRRPKMLVFDLRRAAVAASRRTGDSRTAVVMAAAACETMIDLTLAAIAWEEGLTPEQGAEELDRYRAVTERVANQLARKLGGSWDVKKDLAYRDWRNLVASSRNRVIHGGDIPRPHLAHDVCDAMFAFFGFLLDRLCAPRTRNRYPMACLIVGSRSVLEARGGWSKKMRAAATEADELDLQGVFGRWHSAMAELRLPPDQRRTPREPGRVMLVVTQSGRTYWVEHHQRYRLARAAEVTGDVSRHLESASEHPGSFITFDEPPTYTANGPWLPEYRLLPGIALMRDPRDWYEPSG
ncbi:hypothetical protein ACFPJ1_26205 [Kribbella qitaiheensis]|uniref:hypothetical protein n=1 Tax=Kribbella qitaiheensis TaxID=1544730 RepID=UPI003617CC31